MYNILMLRHVLGLWPTDFEQIVDYGGGSGQYSNKTKQFLLRDSCCHRYTLSDTHSIHKYNFNCIAI